MPAESPPRLRGNPRAYSGPWPLGEIPDRVLYGIGRQLVHRIAIGHGDITGDDFGTIFAEAAGGEHLSRPVGVVDVVADGTAWSVKTVKTKYPENARRVRLISGRNSPDYSLGISNPRRQPRQTGRAVLAVWNSRINASLDEYNELRVAVLIRNMERQEFVLFEQPAIQFPAGDYRWAFNEGGNLEGYDQATGEHCFTWQPHGSQFTIIRPVPGSARRFSIARQVPQVEPEHVLRLVRFNEEWIVIREEENGQHEEGSGDQAG